MLCTMCHRPGLESKYRHTTPYCLSLSPSITSPHFYIVTPTAAPGTKKLRGERIRTSDVYSHSLRK